MSDPLNKDQLDLAILKNNETERTKSDGNYAKKIVEWIVFAVVAAAAMRVVYGSFDVFIGKYFKDDTPVAQQVTNVPITTVVQTPVSSTTPQ